MLSIGCSGFVATIFYFRAPRSRFLPLLRQIYPQRCGGVGSGGSRPLDQGVSGLHGCGRGVWPLSFCWTGLTGLWTGLTGIQAEGFMQIGLTGCMDRSDRLCIGRSVEVRECRHFSCYSNSYLWSCKTCKLCMYLNQLCKIVVFKFVL